MKKVKESAPGKDGVRMIYINHASEEVKGEVVKMVKYMFANRAHKWETSLKEGQIIPLFKKGSRNDKNNYRGVCLLAMGSRILARIMASRLRWWAEHLHLVDDNQCGFRPGRSTADATQIFVRIQEDTRDLRKRRNLRGTGAEATVGDDPEARLLDLRKAYPRVSKPALWGILTRCGIGGSFLDTIVDLHETTSYAVRGREKDSDPWFPDRGLREGCPTSPVLFNIFHQVVMRQAEDNRRRAAEELGREVGLKWRWVPGSNFAGEGLWEKHNSDAVTVTLQTSLFADDTTIIGRGDELEGAVAAVKESMATLEERNNDDKEERLVFGTEEGNEIRMLGCWMGPEEDTRNRKRRAGALWFRIKKQLKNSRLSKKKQAKVVEACVENSLLFDCNTRTWYIRDMKKLQSWIDKAYRYVWSNKTGPPLRQMQREGKNMQDLRNELGVKSVRWKIEKRILERIGHVMRMENSRQTKAAILGWYHGLEDWSKAPGRKRKTVLYWKRLLKEANIDWADIGRITQDRDEWRGIVNARMSHIESWERQRGHMRDPADLQQLERTAAAEDDGDPLRCKWPDCGKVCKNKGGLTIHQRRMHGPQDDPRHFQCDRCRLVFKTENNLLNHTKTCGGAAAGAVERRRCELCGREVSKSNIARHRRACTAGEAAGGARGVVRPEEQVRARVYQARQKPCPRCGRMLAATNMARHLRTCQ
jgi:hypothetical protein